MEPDDALGDDEPQSPLLPPDDRLWRHPSEVGAHGPPSGPPPHVGRAPRLWAVALLAGAAGALLSVAVVTVAGGFRDRVRTVPAVERVALPAGSLSTAAGPAAAGVMAIGERIRPAVVQLVVERDGGSALGSGVMFRSDGHLITNSHVVEGALGITVTMADGARAGARLVGTDAGTDLAVLKVDEWASVPVASLGSATGLDVGQDVMAVGGAPGGDGPAPVAVGMVSALGRQLDRTASPALLDMIQTDTPIAAAWSGGALVDDSGAVVGVITAVTLDAAGSTDVGYATPIDSARAVAEQLVDTGKVVKAWIGIEGGDVDLGTAAALGIEGGAVVHGVRDDSPAGRAGLGARDVIISVDGVPVGSMAALRIVLRSHRPGDVVTLAVVREAGRRAVEVRLAERPAEE